MDLPDFLLVHEVTVKPYTGAGGRGDTYGPPQTVAAFVDHKRRLVRSADGSEVVSESTVYTRLGAVTGDLPPRSRVTMPDGRESKVIAAHDRDAGDLPAPSHLEIVCE